MEQISKTMTKMGKELGKYFAHQTVEEALEKTGNTKAFKFMFRRKQSPAGRMKSLLSAMKAKKLKKI